MERERFRRQIRRISGWMAALFVTMFVLASAAGCGYTAGNAAGIPTEQGTAETSTAISEPSAALPEASETIVSEAAKDAEPKSSAPEPSGQTESPAIVMESSPALPEAPEIVSSEAAADAEPRSDTSDAPSIAEDGTYTSRDDVALYLHTYGRLPSNYITKKEAEELGWKKKQGAAGQLDAVAPGKSIGGSRFGNYEGQLPDKKGRHYYECDINYDKGSRGAERLVYSDDGLIYYTGDHYKTFELLYPQE